MDFLSSIPEWLGTAVIGAIIAALGFLGRDLYSWLKTIMAAGALRKQRLSQIDNILQESQALYRSQRFQAQRLYESILKAQPTAVVEGQSLDQIFARAYDALSEPQRQRHTIIRGVTETTIHRLNTQMSDWLKADTWFKERSHKNKELRELSEYLKQLQLHLNEWSAKYKSVFKGDKRLALNYLADEQKQGTGFPIGIEEKVAAALKAL